MSLKIPFASSLKFQDAITVALLNNATLRLYSNNHVPANADTVADYTEATFPGYAGIALSAWSAAALNASNKAETVLPIQVFTAGVIVTPQDIYGIYVTYDVDGSLLYAELDSSGPITIASTGQSYGYLPRVTYKSEF